MCETPLIRQSWLGARLPTVGALCDLLSNQRVCGQPTAVLRLARPPRTYYCSTSSVRTCRFRPREEQPCHLASPLSHHCTARCTSRGASAPLTRPSCLLQAGESGYRPPFAVDADAHTPAALAEAGDEPSTNTEADDLEDAAVQLQYRIEVVTGTVRGAGTPNMATVQLFGANAASPVYRIGDDGDNKDGSGFERGSTKTYSIRAPQLGALRRIHIKKDLHRASELGSGWFLERIVVTGPEGQEMMFPCHAWIGETDDGSNTGACTACQDRCTLSGSMPGWDVACLASALPGAEGVIEARKGCCTDRNSAT